MSTKAVDTYTAQDPVAGDRALGVTAGGNTRLFNLDAIEAGETQSQFGTPTVIIKDTLRASIEGATGDQMTVLYNGDNTATYMFIVPKFELSPFPAEFGGSVVHPAFIKGGVEKDYFMVGAYQGYTVNGKLVSVPGVDPTVSQDFDVFRSRAVANGTGHHLMSNWEWSALALYVMQQIADGNLSAEPRGNTDDGKAHDAHQETGIGRNGATPGSGDRIITGSGPAGWRHNGQIIGISDFVGNVWEWVDGFKIVDGAIYMPNDNDYDIAEGSWVDQDATIANANPWSSNGVTLGGTANSELLTQALILPATDTAYHPEGRLYVNASGERVPLRGGSWTNGASAGLAALTLISGRGHSSASVGGRPAFVA